MEASAVKSHPQTPEREDKSKKDDSSDNVSNLSEISKKGHPSPQKALYIFSNIFEK